MMLHKHMYQLHIPSYRLATAHLNNSIDIQIPNVGLISPVLTLMKIKTCAINQELAQNGSLEEGTKQRLHPTFHRIPFYLTACEENMMFERFTTSLLNTINDFLTLRVLSSEAMFVYRAFCIFLSKAHRPAGRHSLLSSRGHSPGDPGT